MVRAEARGQVAKVDEWKVSEWRQLVGRNNSKKWFVKGRKELGTTRMMAGEAAEPREFGKKRD